MLIITLQIVGGLIALIGGGELLVRGASALALRFDISPLVVGLTVVAFGTSAPELLISITSALSGSPDLAMGNVVGSNVCNLALVLGITAVVYPVRVQRDSIRLDWPMTMGSSVLLVVLALNLDLARWEGALMVGLLVGYT
ncbi:MAG: sodium:calcium antiporter, partial [Catalinimonas sp.]